MNKVPFVRLYSFAALVGIPQVYCSSVLKQSISSCKGETAQYSQHQGNGCQHCAVFIILLFLDLSFVCQGLMIQSGSARNVPDPLPNREVKASPVRLRNQYHTIPLSLKSQFRGAIQAGEKKSDRSYALRMLLSSMQTLRKFPFLALGGVTVELSRGDAVLRGWILHTCLDLHVSRCMHSRGIIPDLERSGMSNPPWMRTQGIGNYPSMIQGTNEK